MSWVAQGGEVINKASKARRGGGDSASEGDEPVGKTFHGVPLCREAMCRGLPRKPLPQPGINCVNRDNPCLPCDIINLPLRSSVTGARVKQAVADAQKRYFCSVWNLVFSHLFSDHVFSPCLNLQSSQKTKPDRQAAVQEKTPSLPFLPYGTSPGNVITSPPDLKMRTRRAALKMPPKRFKKRRVSALQRDSSRKRSEILPTEVPPTEPEVLPAEAEDEKVYIPYFLESPKQVRKAPIPIFQQPEMPKMPRQPNRGLRYNIWTMPMPDSSKGTYKTKQPYKF